MHGGSKTVRSRRLWTGTTLGLFAALALGGCDHFDVNAATDHLPPYLTTVDTPKNRIDRALDHCPEKTEDSETICVKQALADGRTSVAALAVLMPGCRVGHLCSYRHTSDDRLGYVQPMAADFIVHWRVDFDLRRSPKTIAAVPVSVAIN